MDEKRFYQALDNIAQRNIPETVDVLPMVQKQLRQKKQHYPTRHYPQLAKFAASVLMGLLLMATTVYAVMQWSIHDSALNADLLTEIGLSQTINGTTVQVDWAYADANRIVLAYTMSDAAGQLQRHEATDVVLTDSEGHVYQPVSAFYADFDMPQMLTGNAHFDARIIDNNPESLALQLRVLDAFVFKFSVPFIAGVRIDKQPDIEVNGVKVNLEWAVITPSMTRVYVCYEAPSDELWTPSLQLAFEGQRVAREAGTNYPDFDGIQRRADGRWCRGNIFLAGYEQQPQQITLTITHLQTQHVYSEQNMQRAAEILAGYGIQAIVIRNEVQEEGYLLNIPNPPKDLDVMEQAWQDAMLNMGTPIKGERITGPWAVTVTLP